jgi:hypothetical protein
MSRAEASIAALCNPHPVRVLVNYMLRKDAWFVHAIAADAATPISPILEVRKQGTLIRLLRYVGAGDSDIDEVNRKIGSWLRGSTWIELEPGRRNRLRIRQPWRDEARLAG